jgi:hypothetical protein
MTHKDAAKAAHAIVTDPGVQAALAERLIQTCPLNDECTNVSDHEDQARAILDPKGGSDAD